MNDQLTPGNFADNSIFNQTVARGGLDANTGLLAPVVEDRATMLAAQAAATAAAHAE